MTAPVSAAAAPYATMLNATADIPDVRWRWQAIRQLAADAAKNPIQKPVDDGPQRGRESEAATARSSVGADSRQVGRSGPETGACNTRTCREGTTAVAAPPATGCTCRAAPPGYDDTVDARCPAHGCHQIAEWLDQ